MKSKQTGVLFLFIYLFFLSGAFAQDTGSKIPDMCISGVMSDVNSPIVVIDNEIVKLGDKIRGVKVVNITESTVTLEYEGKTFEKRIGDGCVKAPPVVSQKPTVAVKQKDKQNTSVFSQPKIVTNKKGVENTFFFYGSLILLILWALAVIIYIFLSVCLQKIAAKTATGSGWLAWIPIANLVLMIMMARKPIWWIILLFIPLVNFFIMIILCMEISKMRNKPGWLGLLMMFPGVNLIILGYLAFSK